MRRRKRQPGQGAAASYHAAASWPLMPLLDGLGKPGSGVNRLPSSLPKPRPKHWTASDPANTSPEHVDAGVSQGYDVALLVQQPGTVTARCDVLLGRRVQHAQRLAGAGGQLDDFRDDRVAAVPLVIVPDS
jgi:hypothetical protein